MKRIDMLPKFLQSDFLNNPIIKTKHIVLVIMNDGLSISFDIGQSKYIFWTFESHEQKKEAYEKIKDQLRDIKIIQ